MGKILVGEYRTHHPVIIIPARVSLLYGLHPHRRIVALALDGIGDAVLLGQDVHAVIAAAPGDLYFLKAAFLQQLPAVMLEFMPFHQVIFFGPAPPCPLPQIKHRAEQHSCNRQAYNDNHLIRIHIAFYPSFALLSVDMPYFALTYIFSRSFMPYSLIPFSHAALRTSSSEIPFTCARTSATRGR